MTPRLAGHNPLNAFMTIVAILAFPANTGSGTRASGDITLIICDLTAGSHSFPFSPLAT